MAVLLPLITFHIQRQMSRIFYMQKENVLARHNLQVYNIFLRITVVSVKANAR
jgi:hypothetical protein